MIKLNLPLQNTDIKQIYNTCIISYRDESKTNKRAKYLDKIVSTTKDYLDKIPDDFENFQHIQLSKSDTEILTDIYKNKFTKGPGKKYYDAIMACADGICPFCGIGTPTTLDHYLPKNKYPLLSITPANLIPSCRDCNTSKLMYAPTKNNELIIHPYFDNIDFDWLNSHIFFYEDTTIQIKYYVDSTQINDNLISDRLQSHFKVNKLQEKYSSKFITEFHSKTKLFEKIIELGGKQRLIESLLDEYNSTYCYDKNSWKAAAYRGLYNQSEELFSWLNNNLSIKRQKTY